jgi:hypothetical protein
MDVQIVAKCETRQSLMHFNSISAAADAIIIARGNLGLDVVSSVAAGAADVGATWLLLGVGREGPRQPMAPWRRLLERSDISRFYACVGIVTCGRLGSRCARHVSTYTHVVL